MGRHSTYTPEMGDLICERIANAEPLYRICESPGYPLPETVRDWKRKNPVFAANFARAREECADTLSHQIIDIADSVRGERRSMAHVQAARLAIDARIKMMQLLKPKTYGDRAVVGAAGGGIEIVIRRVDGPDEPVSGLGAGANVLDGHLLGGGEVDSKGLTGTRSDREHE